MNKDSYNHDYYNAGVTNLLTDTVPDLIGKADATDEWKEPATARANFISIESYNQFIDPTRYLLVGRIGSGKTAMLNKLMNSVEHRENKDYSFATMLATAGYIAQLGRTMRLAGLDSLNYTEIEQTAKIEWEKLLNTVAMSKIYETYASSEPQSLKKIKQYLQEQGLLPSQIGLASVLDIISDKIGSLSNLPAQGISAAVNILGQVASTTYADAQKALYSLLQKKGKMVILIDSIEKYEFNDKITLAILNALVNLCLEYNRDNQYLSLKMAAPSELVPKLTSINLEKLSGKMVYIRWSTNDLESCIAVRVYRYLRGVDKEALIDLAEAKRFFDVHYSKTCKTRCGFYFPTFAYCLSHTMKEPRQILSIYNTWLYYESIYPDKNRMDLIEDSITHDELSRVKGSLSIYTSINENIFEMFKRTFNRRKYCFTEADFDEWINTCSGMRGEIDASDLKQYFISSGLVGTMVSLHYVEKNHPVMRNDKIVRIKEVLYEYQVKDCLPYNDETMFCLHPMVFQALNNLVDRNTMVYPRPVEFEDYRPWP